MRTIEVVDVITKYLIIFEFLLGDIKEIFNYLSLDRLSIIEVLFCFDSLRKLIHRR